MGCSCGSAAPLVLNLSCRGFEPRTHARGQGSYQPCVVLGPTEPGREAWRVRFDDGHDRTLAAEHLRRRASTPLRVLGLWGDYFRARVADVLAGGVLRLDFGGDFRWAMLGEVRL